MSTYVLLDTRINCLRLASGTMRYWLPYKRTEWSALARLRSKSWKSYLIGWCSVEQRYAFFFQFDHGFPPWRLLGTKSRWSGFSTKNNYCSLWLLQSRGEEALSISVWQCVLCWSGNCAQQCVKLILYSQIINNHSLSCRLFQHF